MTAYRQIGSTLGCLVVFVVLFASGQLMFDHMFGRPLKAAWEYWLMGLVAGVGMWFIAFATRTGWLRGVLMDPARSEALRARRRRLAEDRQRAIDEAREGK